MLSKRILCGLVATGCLSGACVAPAYNDSQYRSKADVTAGDAVSTLHSVRLALESASRHGLPNNPIYVAISDQEDGLASVAGTFASVQPPDPEMDVLRTKILDLLDVARSKVEEARIEFRRGNVAGALSIIQSTNDVADQLDAIQSRY